MNWDMIGSGETLEQDYLEQLGIFAWAPRYHAKLGIYRSMISGYCRCCTRN